MQISSTILRLLILFTLLGLGACLRDDFNKLADSEWSPDLAFPIVYSELDVNDILIQDQSPTQIIPDALGLVRVIYDSHNYSDVAANIITLPEVSGNFQLSFNTSSINEFNQAPSGFSISDSVESTIPYSLDALLGITARLDTVVFKSGKLILNIQSPVPHPVSVRIRIPNLFIQGQGVLQPVELDAAPLPGSQVIVERNLQGAVLLPGTSEQLEIQIIASIIKSGSALISGQQQNIEASVSFADEAFRSVSGYFGNLQMPFITNDTLQLRLFRNAISAGILEFERASTEYRIQNSTGIPFSYDLQQLSSFRSGQSIPNLNLSAYSFPTPVAGSAEGINIQNYLFNENNSNITEIINRFPVYMVSQQSFSPQQEPVQSYRLRDTSRFSVRQETVLPLNGVTLDLQLRDTFEFDFQGINRDIEEVLLRLSISNGFPVGGFLEVYFCRQNGVNPQAPLVYVDSLYDSSTAQVMDAPEVNSSGEATEQTNQITDVVMGGMDWEKLRDLNCNRIVILARLTTSGNALEEVRILEDDKLSIRLGARIKLRKTF